jgi:hypothetical protein
MRMSCGVCAACLGTHVHQPMGGEFSLHAAFNAALLSPGGAGVAGSASMPPVEYNDSYWCACR